MTTNRQLRVSFPDLIGESSVPSTLIRKTQIIFEGKIMKDAKVISYFCHSGLPGLRLIENLSSEGLPTSGSDRLMGKLHRSLVLQELITPPAVLDIFYIMT
jgi:hypothetical protein